MTLKKENYRERLIDGKIARYLNIFGAICIEGPKWCVKSWTSLNHSNSVTYMTEKSSRDLAKASLVNFYNNIEKKQYLCV